MRKSILYALICFIFFGSSSIVTAQKKTSYPNNKQEKNAIPPKINEPSLDEKSLIPDKSPDYIGGDSAYHNFLDNNLEYPNLPNKDKRIASVRVMASFTVENTGKLSDYSFSTDFEITGKYSNSDYKTIEEKYRSFFEDATKNFLLKMPRWKPAQYKGRDITTEWSLPVVFRYEQNNEPTSIPVENEKEVDEFTRIDKEAEYIGGQTAMYRFIEKNLVLPKSNESKENYQNEEPNTLKIFVDFLIDIDGSVKEIKLKNKSSENEKFESAIIQCFTKMPLWKPAEQNGKPIKMYKQIPIIISQ